MSHLLAQWVFSAIAFMITAYLVPGIHVRGFFPAFIAAAVMAIVNALIWPLLAFLTLPLTILTLGLFLFVVNGACLMLVSALTPGFQVKSFGWAIVGSMALSVVSWILHWLVHNV